MNITELAMLKKMVGGGNSGGGGAYIIELSGSFNTAYTLTDEQIEQINNNFANVVIHLTVDGNLYVLIPLATEQYPTFVQTAITAMNGINTASCTTASLIPNYGLYVGKTIIDLSSGGGASGGLSIKTITFTDRPSAWEWLQNNYNNILRCDLVAGASTISLANVDAVLSSGSLSAIRFIKHNIAFTESFIDMNFVLFAIDAEKTMITMQPKNLYFDDTPEFSINDAGAQTLPDAYWAQMGAQVTFYYFG